jgi:hypothetical protein
MSSRLVVVLIVVIAILAGFYVGDKVGTLRQAASAAGLSTPAPSASGGRGAFGGGGNGVSGPIVSSSAGTVTVQDRATSRNVVVSLGQARISRVSDASATDLTTGTTVTVIGPTGSDGTVNARAVTIGILPGRGGAGRPSPTPSGG